MTDLSSSMKIAALAAAVLLAVIFAVIALRNRNMKLKWTKDGPSVETTEDKPAAPAGGNNISGINVKARDVQGGIRIGHDLSDKK